LERIFGFKWRFRALVVARFLISLFVASCVRFQRRPTALTGSESYKKRLRLAEPSSFSKAGFAERHTQEKIIPA
jgi:hypothetical protein